MESAVALLFFLSALGVALSSVDLNLRQLQFVSDHLTTMECRRLITGLYKTSFQLKGARLPAVKDKEPCLLHLTAWNSRTGDEASVQDLALRLTQIGRHDVAKAISRAVYGETAMEIHKFFLDDPFKKTAHRPGSRLMENDEDEDPWTRKVKVAGNLWGLRNNSRFAMAVVGLTLTLTFVIFAVMVVYCPASFRSTCPRTCVATYDAIKDSVTAKVQTLKLLTATEAFGINREQARKPRSRDQASANQEEQDRLVQSLLAV